MTERRRIPRPTPRLGRDLDRTPVHPAPKPLRIGFLGAGLVATYHSKSLRRSGVEAEVGAVRAGVYDTNAERAAAFAAASGHRVCAGEDEVLDSCDAVYVCTWTSEHPRQVAKAVERRLAVFCEKPLATTRAGAEAMAAGVADSGIINQVGLVLRHSPAYIYARHLVSDRVAGRVMAVVFRDDQFIPVQGHYASTWRGDSSLVGSGTLLEHSIHDVDMLRFIVGDVERVSAHRASFHGLDGIEDVVSATMTFESGACGTLTTVWHDILARPSLRRVEIFCERRYVVIESHDWFGPVSWTDSDGTTGSIGEERIEAAVAGMIDSHPNPDGAFLQSIAARRPAWPDFDAAVLAHRVVDAMYTSAARGGDGVDVDRG